MSNTTLLLFLLILFSPIMVGFWCLTIDFIKDLARDKEEVEEKRRPIYIKKVTAYVVDTKETTDGSLMIKMQYQDVSTWVEMTGPFAEFKDFAKIDVPCFLIISKIDGRDERWLVYQ